MSKSDQMRDHLERWQNSKLSVKAYCQEAGLNIQKFHYWRKKFAGPSDTDDAFITVKPNSRQEASQDSSTIRLSYPNGVILELPGNSPLALLQSLIHF